MKKIAKKNILKVKPYLPGKPIEEVKRDLGLKSVVKLASNENPFPPSKKVLAAMRKELSKLNRYPDGSCFYLRKELARQFKIDESQLIFGNGSDEIIVLVTRAFTGKGDEVIIAKPTFLIYEIAAKISGATIKMVPLKDFHYDLQAMKKAVTKKTKIIFIANPNNPTGTYVKKAEVDKFLKGLRKDILVFFDEAYYEFANKRDYPDSLSLIRKHKNVIFTRTFSKSYSLAGLRVGYGVASAETVDILNRIREPFNVNSVAQVGALASLKDKSYHRLALRMLDGEKRYLYQNLKKMNISFVESAANFVLIDVGQDSLKVFQKLLRKGVIVRDMGFWGLDTFIRVTIGTPRENDKFIKALKEIL